MAQTPAKFEDSGDTIDYTPVAAVTAGDVIVVGTIPAIAPCNIAASVPGVLKVGGKWKVPKDTSTFTQGDSVHWDTNGTPVTGDALSGAATSTTSGNNLMGMAAADAATGDSYVYVTLTAARRTTTIAGSVTADDITGSDSTLTIAGLAGSAGSAGGAIPIVGGAGHTNGAGGASGITGGAGAGTGAGGAVNLTGGASGNGATGNGGAASVVGGAALSTNGVGGAVTATGGVGKGTGAGGAITITSGAGGASGTGAGGALALAAGASGTGATGAGGAVTITGGAALSTNGNGGSITLTPGALAGTGAPGAIKLTGFVHGTIAQTIAMGDAAVTLTRIPGTPTGTLLTGTWLLVDAESSGSENLLLPPEADCTNVLLLIKNTGGETINLQNDAGGALATIATSETCFAQCDGTTWTVMQHVFTT